jgi:hypothetical protein
VLAGSVMTLPVPAWIARSLGIGESQGTLTKGETDNRLAGYQTDGYNNEKKAYRVSGKYVVMYAVLDSVRLPSPAEPAQARCDR